MPDVVDELTVDWYGVLGCNSESTKTFIEQSARKLFRLYHPDKTSDPKAPELFLRVQKAKEILLDDTKRKAIDDAKVLITKRQDYDNERSKNMDVRRKRMRDDLEEILKKGSKGAATVGHSASGQTGGPAKQKDQSADIDRLRRVGASLREASAREAEFNDAKRSYDSSKEKKYQGKTDEINGGLCQIKIKWKRSRQSHSDESLALLFKVFGDVEVVTMIGDKGNSATILFSLESSADRAVSEYAASTEYRVTIPAKDLQNDKKRAAIFTHIYATSNAATLPHKGAEIFGSDLHNNSQESDLISQMRRAVEREELIRSLEGDNRSLNPDMLGDIDSSKTQLGSTQSSGTASVKPSSTINKPVSAPSLAFKEADVLKRMMEAAKLKKLKAANCAAAAEVPSS